MARSPAGRRPRWADWPTEKLLDLRFRDLGLDHRGTWIEEEVGALHEALARRGLSFRPHVWLSTEWFTPTGVPGFAVPFYLAHPRLARLERSLVLEVEGGNRQEFRQILRHECGHALQNGWALNRRRRWRELFGRSSERYPDRYRPDPSSRNHVQHLRMYYAQSHPDEDFAETFAVWVGPRDLWRKRYAGWPALQKLEYIDELMDEVRATPQKVRSRRQVDPVGRLDRTLREHYQERLEETPRDVADIYDADLERLFIKDPDAGEPAARFLRRHASELRSLVTGFSGQDAFTLDQVLQDMIRRCRVLKLRAAGHEATLLMQFSVLLTVQTMHLLYRRREWVSM